MEGQLKLKAARVLCIGAGGLGSPLALISGGRRAWARLESLTSTLWTTRISSGRSFTPPRMSAAEAGFGRREAEGHQSVSEFRKTFDTRLSSENALELFREFDIIADGTDNFPTRYLVNDACVLTGKPNVYGSIFRFEGQASVFATKDGPCYRCLYPEPPPPGLVPSCAEGGVLGILPGLVGVMQATETIKLILGAGEPLIGTTAADRRARHEVPRTEAAQESRLPGLRHPSHDQKVDRLQ